MDTAEASRSLDPNAALTFVPGIAFAEVEAGKQAQVSIVVKNQTKVDVKFDVISEDMVAGSGRGEQREFQYRSAGTSHRGAGTWLQVQDRKFTLRAGTQQRVDVDIDVPQAALSGGGYAALRFSAAPLRSDEKQLSFRSVSWVPILLTVSGKINRDLHAVLVPEERLKWSGGPTRWLLELRNDGDLHELIHPEVSVKSTFTGRSKANLKPIVLLPHEKRTLEASFVLRSAPDTWRADARIERQQAPLVRLKARNIWIIPWWVLLGVVLISLLTYWRLKYSHDQ